MAHNIFRNRIAYTGEEPWHGIGTELNKPATAEEAIEAAQLDYEIDLQPIFLKNGQPIKNRMATVRKEGEVPFGIVSPKYKIIQNVEAFSFFDNVVKTGEAIYHVAGALGEGEIIWILAKLPKDIILFKDDIIKEYLLLTNSHDGKKSLQMYFTPVRVVCQNTLNASLKDSRNGISIRHMGDINFKVNEARKALGLALEFYGDLKEQIQVLGKYSMNNEKVNAYYDTLLGIDKAEKPTTRSLNVKNELLFLFENGKGNKNPLIRHSAWCAYNAVTEYCDHFKTVKSLDRNPSNRLRDIWLGSGSILKSRALDEIMAVVKK